MNNKHFKVEAFEVHSKEEAREVADKLLTLDFGVDLENNVWYVLGKKGNSVLKFQNGSVTYGFVDGKYIDNARFDSNKRVQRKATDEEVSIAFNKEITRRYEEGDRVIGVLSKIGHQRHIYELSQGSFTKEGTLFISTSDNPSVPRLAVFSKGVWAKVVEDEISIGDIFRSGNRLYIFTRILSINKYGFINIKTGNSKCAFFEHPRVGVGVGITLSSIRNYVNVEGMQKVTVTNIAFE